MLGSWARRKSRGQYIAAPATLRRVERPLASARRGPKPRTHRSPGFCSLTFNDPPRKRVARRIESRVHGWHHWRPLSRTQTRACGPACAHALPPRTGPACSVTFSKFTCIPERPGGRSGPGSSEPGRRAGSGPSGPGREPVHGESHRGRPKGTGTERATGLELPGFRMQRRLGTDAPRARCMLMAGGRAMNYSAAARRGRARLGGRPGPRVPRRCRAAAPTSQTFPGPHRGCGPRGAAVPARARWPRFPRCRLFYVFCLGVGTCPRERVSLPTPSPPDRGGGGGTGDRGGGDEGSEEPACPASWGDRPGEAAAVPEHPGTPAPRGGQGCERARNTNEAAVPAAGRCVRAPPLPGGPHPDGRARAGRAAGAADSPPRPRAWPRSSACAPPWARRPGRSPLARARPAAPPVAFARPPYWAQHRGDPPVEPRGPTQRRGLSRSASPVRAARAALARRRLPGRAPRLRSKALAAMIAGSTGTRVHARGRLGPSVDSDPVCPAAAQCALRTAARVA